MFDNKYRTNDRRSIKKIKVVADLSYWAKNGTSLYDYTSGEAEGR